MAELNQNSQNGSKPQHTKTKKLTAKVDLTAMVDLAFLLITFFMLTTSLSEAKAMDLVMPEATGNPMPVDENRTLTIAIEADNNTKCFMGKNENDARSVSVGKELRAELLKRKKEVHSYSISKGKPDQGLIVLIKPGKDSSYGNLVDVLDEMAISGITKYAIVD